MAGTGSDLHANRFLKTSFLREIRPGASVSHKADYRWQKDISDNNKCNALHCRKFIRNCQ
jgi:hypothetical protein